MNEPRVTPFHEVYNHPLFTTPYPWVALLRAIQLATSGVVVLVKDDDTHRYHITLSDQSAMVVLGLNKLSQVISILPYPCWELRLDASDYVAVSDAAQPTVHVRLEHVLTEHVPASLETDCILLIEKLDLCLSLQLTRFGGNYMELSANNRIRRVPGVFKGNYLHEWRILKQTNRLEYVPRCPHCGSNHYRDALPDDRFRCFECADCNAAYSLFTP